METFRTSQMEKIRNIPFHLYYNCQLISSVPLTISLAAENVAVLRNPPLFSIYLLATPCLLLIIRGYVLEIVIVIM